ncbi:MAG: tail fiber domain-containing protein [Salinivirgaceae bacterium]|nr:tail fiber domain-containing protein [Salinivirgaceae bacterium]
MRKLLFILIGIVLTAVLFGQNHNGFKYQAVLRAADGKVIADEELGLRISILTGSETGSIIYTEEHLKSTNTVGLVHLNIGTGNVLIGDFAGINWGSNDYFLQIELNRNNEGFVVLGISPLLSVPYAIHAESVTNKDDADADSFNEIQDLNLSGSILKITNNESATEIDMAPFMDTNTDEQTLLFDGDSLVITNGNKVDLLPYKDNTDEQQLIISGTELSIGNGNTIDLSNLPDSVIDDDANATNELQNLSLTSDSIMISDGNGIPLPNGLNLWISDGTNILLPNGNLGLGTGSPTGKLEVRGNAVDTPDDLLFGVMNNNGDTVFAVYQEGVRIYVNDTPGKALGSRGGFAVGGYSSGKVGLTNEYLRVTPDSVRIYVDETNGKAIGSRGGFAVGGYSSGKGIGANEYLRVTPDSVRVYVDNATTKAVGSRGGFAVGGYSSGKGPAPEYLRVTADSTRIYVEDPNAGFSIGNTETGITQNLMKLTKENYFIGHNSGTNTIPSEISSLGRHNSFFGFETGLENTTGHSNVFIGKYAGKGNTIGVANNFIGNYTGTNNQSGSYNVFLGDEAGISNTIGENNVFIGNATGWNNKSGSDNVFMGHNAGINNATGSFNVYLGSNAGQGYVDASGDKNVFIGYEAGNNNASGANNVFLGYQSGLNNSIGLRNVFIGQESGAANINGIDNVFLGHRAGWSNSDGDFNVFVGERAGEGNISGEKNIYLGNMAGYSNQYGNKNVYIGFVTGYNSISANNNIFIGDSVGYSNTSGYNNVYMGVSTGRNNTTGSANLFLGESSGYSNTKGGSNVFMGFQSGYSNNLGNANVFIGKSAGYKNANAAGNVIIGEEAGYNNNASRNIMIGRSAGNANTTGDDNVFIGSYSGKTMTTGRWNTFLGVEAGDFAEGGSGDVYLGHRAGYDNNGSYNVIIGDLAGSNSQDYSNPSTTFTRNVMVGQSSGYAHSAGDNNTYLGSQAGRNHLTGAENVFIGYKAGYNAKGSNQLYIENSNADSTMALIYGEFNNNIVRINTKLGIGIYPTTNALEVEGTCSNTGATGWSTNSDKRIKTDIQNINNAFETILKLRPVMYKYTEEWKAKHPTLTDKYYYNYVAQEFQKVFPESVTGSGQYLNDDPDEILQMDGHNAQIVAIKAIQELIIENQNLKSKVESLETQINKYQELKNSLNVLKAEIERMNNSTKKVNN